MAAWSLLTAAVMLLVFRHTSDQERMAHVKRQIHACLFEIRLFTDDLRAVLQAQHEVLGHNLRYLLLTLRPMAWILVPLVLVVGQLQFRYGYQGFEPGRAGVLAVELAPAALPAPGQRPEANLVAPDGVRVETAAVWAPALGELAWRVAAVRPGRYELTVEVAGERVSKTFDAAPGVARRSPRRPSSAVFDQLVYPAEAPVPPHGPITAVRLDYPSAAVSLAGIELHWMVWYFLLSIAFALALRKPFGVVI